MKTKPFYTLTPEQFEALQAVINYMWNEESSDYDTMVISGEVVDHHVFKHLAMLAEAVDDNLV